VILLLSGKSPVVPDAKAAEIEKQVGLIYGKTRPVNGPPQKSLEEATRIQIGEAFPSKKTDENDGERTLKPNGVPENYWKDVELNGFAAVHLKLKGVIEAAPVVAVINNPMAAGSFYGGYSRAQVFLPNP